MLNNTAKKDARRFVWENPGRIIDRNGRPVDCKGEVWALQTPTDNIDINWNTLHTATDIKNSVKSYAAHTIESKAPNTAHQVFKQIKYCLNRLPPLNCISDITYEAIADAVAHARIESKDWHFSYIRRWYQWCADHGLAAFSDETARRLCRLKISDNPTGLRVMSRDVDAGPLSDDEHLLVRRAVHTRKGRLKDRVIIMLLLETGARPVQLVQLEEQDFIVNSYTAAHIFHSLNIPRAKQRQIGKPEKKRRRISPELGIAIEALIKQNHVTYGDRGLQMPILCVGNAKTKKLTKELKVKYELHVKVPGLLSHVRDYPSNANIISPRTGKLLKLHPLRLRYTYFTRLAEQGAAANHLAELADHSSKKSIAIYVSSTSNVVDRLNAAFGKDRQYSDTIARFLGQLVARKENSDGAVIPGSTPGLKNLGGIGVCGANFLCDLYPPLSCYVCPKFQAWIEGPHKELLDELKSFVRSLIENSTNPADRVPYQLVEVMTSIRQLLLRIEDRNNAKENARA